MPGTGTVCILAVDDEQAILDLVADVLGMDYQVLCARSGLEALEVLKTHGCDLILVDLGMPGMDGLELIRHIREDEQTRSIPIAVMSAYTELRSKVPASEVQAVIAKPFGIEELRDTIGRLLTRNDAEIGAK